MGDILSEDADKLTHKLQRGSKLGYLANVSSSKTVLPECLFLS